MSNKRYIQINLDEGDIPDEETWQAFVKATFRALEDSTRGDFPPIEIHEGEGYWRQDLAELSLHISTVADVDLFALRTKLARIKREYNQKAIALIVGSDLI